MMTLNLLDEVKDYFNNEFISEASRNLNETPAGITEALSAILPATIGLIAKQTKKPGGASKIATLASAQRANGILAALGNFIKHKETADTTKLTSTAFAGDVDKDMISTVASFSKIKNSSAATLFDIALPTILALVGRHVNDNKIETKDLAEFFADATTTKQTIMPTGYGATGVGAVVVEEPIKVVGAETETSKTQNNAILDNQYDKIRPMHAQDPTHMDDASLHAAVIEGPINPISGFSWVTPLLVIFGLVLVLWFFTMGAGNRYQKPYIDENKTATPFTRERIQPGMK